MCAAYKYLFFLVLVRLKKIRRNALIYEIYTLELFSLVLCDLAHAPVLRCKLSFMS